MRGTLASNWPRASLSESTRLIASSRRFHPLNESDFASSQNERPKGQLETCACETRPNGDPLVLAFVVEHQQRHVWRI